MTHQPVFTTPTTSIPDAEHLYVQLLSHLRIFFAQSSQPPALIGIHRGGAWLVERGTMPNQRILRLADLSDGDAPYFAIVIVHGHGRRPEVEE